MFLSTITRKPSERHDKKNEKKGKRKVQSTFICLSYMHHNT